MKLPATFEHDIFAFVTEEDRQRFIDDVRSNSPQAEIATNIDPVETYADRFLVAVRIPSKQLAAVKDRERNDMSNITFADIGKANNVTMQFENGYELSITKGSEGYSGTDTAEIAVLKDGKFVRIEGQGDDVIGWVTTDTIASVAYWLSLVDSSTGYLGAVRDAINDRSDEGVL